MGLHCRIPTYTMAVIVEVRYGLARRRPVSVSIHFFRFLGSWRGVPTAVRHFTSPGLDKTSSPKCIKTTTAPASGCKKLNTTTGSQVRNVVLCARTRVLPITNVVSEILSGMPA